MTAFALQRRRDDLTLHLKGLVLVGALLELRGASPAEIDGHVREAARVRAELAQLTRAAGSDDERVAPRGRDPAAASSPTYEEAA